MMLNLARAESLSYSSELIRSLSEHLSHNTYLRVLLIGLTIKATYPHHSIYYNVCRLHFLV